MHRSVALAAPIGGMAPYPSMVIEEDSAETRAGRVAPMVHQYLSSTAGRRYWEKKETRESRDDDDLVGQNRADFAARYPCAERPPAARRQG